MNERLGNYRILDEIGYGGMAVVYKGVQESLGRTVAIKALRTSLSSEKESVARFEREAMSMASFQHENIITVYDFFPHGGALFIVMEYVEGIDLHDLLDKCERLPDDIAVIVALQVARALDYAHFRGVIHRDVKPGNIILSKRGTVKLTDFGIARLDESELTWTGVGLGTPAYMSPEQVTGQRLDARSDIFSLGIVLYQMVTGLKPFDEDGDRSTLHQIRHARPEPPRSLNPALSRDLERIVLRCLEKAPQDRFASTQELIALLEQFLAQNVNLNYRARLLLFLQSQGVLTAEEIKTTIHPALIGRSHDKGPAGARRPVGQLLRGLGVMALMAVAGAAGFTVGGRGSSHGTTGAVQAGGPSPEHRSTGANASASTAIEVGRLHVVAHPWARVEVDGVEAGVTPLVKPLELAVGRHRLTLRNPYYLTDEREVAVTTGRLTTVRVELRRKAGADGGPP